MIVRGWRYVLVAFFLLIVLWLVLTALKIKMVLEGVAAAS